MKTECDYLSGQIKKHIRKTLTQTGELQRYSWGTQKKRKKWLNSLYGDSQNSSWGMKKKKHCFIYLCRRKHIKRRRIQRRKLWRKKKSERKKQKQVSHRSFIMEILNLLDMYVKLTHVSRIGGEKKGNTKVCMMYEYYTTWMNNKWCTCTWSLEEHGRESCSFFPSGNRTIRFVTGSAKTSFIKSK